VPAAAEAPAAASVALAAAAVPEAAAAEQAERAQPALMVVVHRTAGEEQWCRRARGGRDVRHGVRRRDLVAPLEGAAEPQEARPAEPEAVARRQEAHRHRGLGHGHRGARHRHAVALARVVDLAVPLAVRLRRRRRHACACRAVRLALAAQPRQPVEEVAGMAPQRPAAAAVRPGVERLHQPADRRRRVPAQPAAAAGRILQPSPTARRRLVQ
jgi:hypothetical protein